MCPTTLAMIAVGATVGGDILGGLSAAGQANYKAQVAKNNATIARNNAAYAASATAGQTEQEGLKARARGSGVRAALAAGGVDVNSGSAGEVQTSQREIGALEQSTVANRGARQVYGYETEATSFDAEKRLYQSQVVPDILGGVLKGVGAAAGAAPDIPGATPSDSSPTITGTQPSLLSGAPTVSSEYAWMLPGSGATAQEQYDYGDF